MRRSGRTGSVWNGFATTLCQWFRTVTFEDIIHDIGSVLIGKLTICAISEIENIREKEMRP